MLGLSLLNSFHFVSEVLKESSAAQATEVLRWMLVDMRLLFKSAGVTPECWHCCVFFFFFCAKDAEVGMLITCNHLILDTDEGKQAKKKKTAACGCFGSRVYGYVWVCMVYMGYII